MEQLIIDALKSACGNKNIKFQVIIKDGQLHIYANHRQNYHPQYAILESNVGAAIASLNLETVDRVWLYARPLGQIEPNWQVLVELPTQASGDLEKDTEANQKSEPQPDPLDDLPNLESLIEVEEKGDYDPTILSSMGDTGKIQQNLLDESETVCEDAAPEISVTDFAGFDNDTDNSLGDTGLLQNIGLVHGSPFKEAEIGTMPANEERESISTDPTTDNPLAKYCFITNKKLLTEEAPDPERDTMRMVKFVHHLSEGDRLQLLSILDTYFREGITPGLETTLPASQNWVKKVRELDEADRHLLAVWLSRYCFNPKTTLEEFEAISAAKAAAESNKNSKNTRSKTEYSFVAVSRNLNSNSTADKDLELDEPKFQLPPKVKRLLLPGIWILTTLILIILGIFAHNSQLIATSARIPALCNNTIGSPEYCRLAVNLVGDKTIAQTPESLFPLTEVTETVADYGCGRYANLKAGIDIAKIPPATTPVISTYGEKVFPHIYAVVVEQKQAQQPGNIKVGCVYTAGQGQRSPKKLSADLIPLNWPNEHYQQQQESGSITFGIYSKPIKLGLYTIFAALGIAIVSRLNLGLKIDRVHTIYLVALLLGMVQLIISFLTGFVGLLGAMIMPIVAILAASSLLRDFQLNWKRGYPSVAITALAIVAIQLLFSSFCLGLISGLV